MTNPADLLIDHETGNLDWTWIKRLAMVRAEREFGGPNPPMKYVRDQIRWAQDRARGMRTAWRRDHGLPDESEMVMVNVPTWGNGGDSFAKGV